MSQSIDIHVYDVQKLKDGLDTAIASGSGQKRPSEVLDAIMPACGVVINGVWVLQRADAWDDYDPWGNVIYFFDSVYDADVFNVFNNAEMVVLSDGVSVEDLYEAAGIQEPDEDEE